MANPPPPVSIFELEQYCERYLDSFISDSDSDSQLELESIIIYLIKSLIQQGIDPTDSLQQYRDNENYIFITDAMAAASDTNMIDSSGNLYHAYHILLPISLASGSTISLSDAETEVISGIYRDVGLLESDELLLIKPDLLEPRDLSFCLPERWKQLSAHLNVLNGHCAYRQTSVSTTVSAATELRFLSALLVLNDDYNNRFECWLDDICNEDINDKIQSTSISNLQIINLPMPFVQAYEIGFSVFNNLQLQNFFERISQRGIKNTSINLSAAVINNQLLTTMTLMEGDTVKLGPETLTTPILYKSESETAEEALSDITATAKTYGFDSIKIDSKLS